VTQRFRQVAPWFADVRDHESELLRSGVSADIAHEVSIERFRRRKHGAAQTGMDLRPTHVFRREEGAGSGRCPAMLTPSLPLR